MRNSKWGIALSNNSLENTLFLDTTLRDGEQTPGVSLTPENKLRIAKQLDELGVNIIEAGSAVASEGEIKAIKMIVKEKLKAEICSFARIVRGDIDAVVKSEAQSVHLVVPTSPTHLKYKLEKTEDQVLNMVVDTVQYAKDQGLIIELSAEDSTRSDINFLKKVFTSGVEAGADRLCACDTVGILTPERSFEFYSDLSSTFKKPISVHCHNDFGMAVANSIAALRGGAAEVHVTVNGLGERAGNAALEEVVMSLIQLYKVKLSIKTQRLHSTSSLVSRLMDVPIQPNKAIVGDNAFTHQAGIHTHAVLALPSTYEPLPPELVGVHRRFVAGKLSGIHGLKALLESLELKPSDDQMKDIFSRVKSLGDKGKKITDVDLYTIAEMVMELPKVRPIKLKELSVMTGNKITPTAAVTIDMDGKTVTEAAVGDGPVDAAVNAINKAVAQPTEITLERYNVKAITGGTNAMVEVTVQLRKGNMLVSSMGVHNDIVMASVEAMLSGINVLAASASRNKLNHNNKKVN
ncbi:2-isopropylmalate synthase [Candidatus Bathyarchaeota archaeon]|nr:2-isopropylmalate synthase [Candidatus Bathyarchaeota archaeon]